MQYENSNWLKYSLSEKKVQEAQRWKIHLYLKAMSSNWKTKFSATGNQNFMPNIFYFIEYYAHNFSL